MGSGFKCIIKPGGQKEVKNSLFLLMTSFETVEKHENLSSFSKSIYI